MLTESPTTPEVEDAPEGQKPSKLPQRCWAFGARAPTVNVELFEREIVRSHRYYNDWIDIFRRYMQARERAKTYTDTWEGEGGNLGAWEFVKATKTKPATERPGKTAYAAKMDPGVSIALHEQLLKEQCKARKRSGTSWSNYQYIEMAAKQAFSDSFKPKLGLSGKRKPVGQLNSRLWTNEGAVTVHLQGGGLPVSKLLEGRNLFARIIGKEWRRELHLRVASKGRQPIWTVVPFTYHRDLPSDGIVKWIRVHKTRVGSHYKYSAQFVVLAPIHNPRPAPTKELCAIDVGWRRLEDGSLRVATWIDSEGNQGQLCLPSGTDENPKMMQRFKKCDDIQGIRQDEFNAAVKRLREVRDAFPAWLREEVQYAHTWHTPAQLTGIVLRWRDRRFDGDTTLFTEFENWRKHSKHLWDWEAFQNRNVLLARKDIYRRFACQMATYKKVVIEKLDLRQFQELPKEGETPDTPIRKKARTTRVIAALSILLECVADAMTRAGGMLVDSNPAWTTRDCSLCGSREAFDTATNVMHTCSKCGATWDQDVNASKNLLRAIQLDATGGSRSKRQAVEETGETNAEARRRRGLETRRAKRSKKE